MSEYVPTKCGLGECGHSSFPHSVITVPERTVTRTGRDGSKTAETIPGASFLICITCRHWVRSGAKTTCPCDCHKGGARRDDADADSPPVAAS